MARNYILMLGLALVQHFPGNMERSSRNVVSAYANCYSHPTEGFSCLCLFPFLSLSLCVCVHVLCHNGTWVLHKMCSLVFLLLFFRSVANRTSFTCVSGISCCDTAPSNMNNLFLLLLLCFVCWFLLALVFLFFTRAKSRTRGETGGRVKWKQPQQRENAGKVFLAAFRIAPFGPTNLCVQFVA